MNKTQVSSSNLSSVGYDSATKTLEVTFNSGMTYQYFNVPKSEYDSLMSAASKGSYFNNNIRNSYKYQQI